MSMARSTAAIASLPQTSFCSGLATGASARTPEMFSLAFMAAIRAGERRSYQVSNGASEERIDVAGQRIPAPCDVVVGAHQREISRIQISRLVAGNVDHRERHATPSRRHLDRTCVDTRVEPQQREVAPQAIEY